MTICFNCDDLFNLRYLSLKKLSLRIGDHGLQGEEGEKGPQGDQGRPGLNGRVIYKQVPQGK